MEKYSEVSSKSLLDNYQPKAGDVLVTFFGALVYIDMRESTYDFYAISPYLEKTNGFGFFCPEECSTDSGESEYLNWDEGVIDYLIEKGFTLYTTEEEKRIALMLYPGLQKWVQV